MTAQSGAHRRLAAIMFTDMVGYSGLTQRNEKLALELLDEHRTILRPLFPRYGGREIETAGDAFFVEFDSALEAARCAIEIQETLHERNRTNPPDTAIRLRIGLHLGDVVFSNKNAHGDGVNIAARIEPLASPEGICVSEDVARQIHNKIDLPVLKLGRGELKNIGLPMQIHRIVMPWEKIRRPAVERLAFHLKHHKSRFYGAAAAVGLLLLLLYSLKPLMTVSRERNSIAVLPFKNIGGERENQYFSEGITEVITSQISKIRNLAVISSASTRKYVDQQTSHFDIGNQLQVAALLEGSVQRTGGDVIINANLIDPENDKIIWGEYYKRDAVQVYDIQNEVALSIARALRANMSPDERDRVAKKATDNFVAYDLYLKGRYHWNLRFPDQIEEGIGYFKSAIAEDPAFALAYAGLADSYTLLGIYQIHHPDSIYPLAKQYALQAIRIDSMLAEAHTSLAYVVLHYDRNWPEAEKEFRLAIALNPNYANAHIWYAFFLTVTGRFEEATVQVKRALELDPKSASVSADAGIDLYFMRQYDRAIGQLKATLALDPQFVLAKMPLGGAYVQKKMYPEAIKEFSELLSASSFMMQRPHPLPMAALVHACAAAGRGEDARMYLELMEERGKTDYVAPYWMAIAYLGLGEKGAALDYLEKAYRHHDVTMVLLNVDPVFDPLRSEPRFVKLIDDLGLKPAGTQPGARASQ